MSLKPALLGAWALLYAFSAFAESAPLDVRVVVDVSGSMKSSDPANLRADAVRVIAEQLPDGALAGIWTFGSKVNMAVPHGVVDDAWRRRARDFSNSVSSVALRTNLAEALKTVSWDAAADSGVPRHILMLTDGRVDLSDDGVVNDELRRQIINEQLPKLHVAGIQLHALALSPDADVTFMRQIASASGGYHGLASNSATLRAFVARSLMPGSTVAPGGDVAASEADASFVVAAGTTELIVLAETEEPLTFVTPAEQRIDASIVTPRLRWFESGTVVLASVDGPAAGRWHLMPNPVRYTVYTHLEVAIHAGDSATAPLSVQLTEAGEPVRDPALLDLLLVDARRVGPQGNVPLMTRLKADATFEVALGEAALREDEEVQVHLLGNAFERAGRFRTADAHPVEVSVLAGAGRQADVVVRIYAPEVDASSVRVVGTVKELSGRAKLVVGIPESDTWRVAVPALADKLEIGLKIVGNYLNKKELDVRISNIDLTLPVLEPRTLIYGLDGLPVVERTPVDAPPAVDAPEGESDPVLEVSTPTVAAPNPAPSVQELALKPTPVDPIVWIGLVTTALTILGSFVVLAWIVGRNARPVASLELAIGDYRQALEAARAQAVPDHDEAAVSAPAPEMPEATEEQAV